MARGGSGAPTSSRGRGKFKVSRGGGRHFSRDISTIDHGMESLGLGEDEDSDEEEESSEEESDDGLGGGSSNQQSAPEMTRAERKALKKAQAGKKGGKAPAVGDIPEGSESESDDEPLPTRESMGPSRREKEEAAKKQASENYQKLHAAGKTDQFKKDMERLQEVKRRREKEAAERKAKDEEAKREAEEKRQARLQGKR